MATIGDVSLAFRIEAADSGILARRVKDDGAVSVAIPVEAKWKPGAPLCEARVNGSALALQVRRRGEAFVVTRRGARLEIMLRTRRQTELALRMPRHAEDAAASALLCPMPGLVVSIEVEEDDEVEAGQALATVEAMKMENVLRADRKARISRILVEPGDVLAVDDVILEFA